MTSGEGEKMQAEITDLRTRLDDIDKRDKEYKEQVVRLRKVLDEATSLLTRNSADVGAKAAKAEQDIAAIQGRIEELQHAADVQARQLADEDQKLETRLVALEQTQTKVLDKVAPTMPDDKDQLWTQAGQRSRCWASSSTRANATRPRRSCSSSRRLGHAAAGFMACSRQRSAAK